MRVEERENHQLSKSASEMTSIPGTPSLITPIADNIQMDIDSDPEAEQAARKFAQAEEWLHIVNEARERRREEQKRKEEEEEARRVAEKEAEEEAQRVARETAAREAEELLEMEWQYQLQVSTGVLWNSTWTNLLHRRIWRRQ